MRLAVVDFYFGAFFPVVSFRGIFRQKKADVGPVKFFSGTCAKDFAILAKFFTGTLQ